MSANYPTRSAVRLKQVALALLLSGAIAACSGPTEQQGPPAAPSGVTSEPGPGYVTVTWTDNSDNETGFAVYRSQQATAAIAAQQTGEPIAELPANSTTYVDLDVELNLAYEYQVVAQGAAGASTAANSSAAVSLQPGVDLLVGTVDRVYSDSTTGTIFIVYLVFDDEIVLDDSLDISGSITGPAGWNGDLPLGWRVPGSSPVKQSGFFRYSVHAVDSVAGTYTLSAEVGGATYQATAELTDTAFRLPKPTDLDVSVSADETEVSATWTTPPEALVTYASLHTEDWGTMLNRELAGDGHTFTGLELPDGSYLFDVMVLNAALDSYPIKVEPFGQAAMYAPFGIGDPQSALCDSPEQLVEIPDSALREAVMRSLYRDEGDLKCIDLTLLTWVWQEGAGVTSLEGLQYADSLETVALGENEVTSLEPLRGLENLTGVSMFNNPITDGSPLAGKTTLEIVDLGGSQISDVSFVEGLINVERLELWGLADVDLTPVHGLTQVEHLALSGTGMDDSEAAFLEDMTALSALYLEDNDLTSIAPLLANTGLGDGDEVWINNNLLDLSDSNVMDDIQELIGRGVSVHYEEQR